MMIDMIVFEVSRIVRHEVIWPMWRDLFISLSIQIRKWSWGLTNFLVFSRTGIPAWLGHSFFLKIEDDVRISLLFGNYGSTPSRCLQRWEQSRYISSGYIRLYHSRNKVNGGERDSCSVEISCRSKLQDGWMGCDCWLGIELTFRQLSLRGHLIFWERQVVLSFYFILVTIHMNYD